MIAMQKGFPTSDTSDLDSDVRATMDCCLRNTGCSFDKDRMELVLSSSIMGRFDDHFFGCKWYLESFVVQPIIRDSENREIFCDPIGFGFQIFDYPGVDKVMEATHLIKGKPISIKRTVLVSGLPKSVTEAEFKSFFSKFGVIVDHEINNGHRMPVKQPRSYGFLVFYLDQAVDDLLAMDTIYFAGTKVSIHQAEIHKLKLRPGKAFTGSLLVEHTDRNDTCAGTSDSGDAADREMQRPWKA